MSELLTVAEVAAVLHCSKAHVCNLVGGRVRDCRPIPAIRMGRRMLIRREALQAWIAANENDSLPFPERKRA
ncbi:MAG: helix-turn-helix domain-containing protein [Acidobacteriia bacterium]|nr:helix-turn-helix domain-containing protein [Terriglobia bacterium]